MQKLRRSRALARLLTVWLVLWAGVVLASPAFAAAGLTLVCAGGSVQLVSPDPGNPSGDLAGHLPGQPGHCPLCLQPALPPPPQFALRLAAVEAPHEAPAIAPRPPVGSTAPPLPARGPPRAA